MYRRLLALVSVLALMLTMMSGCGKETKKNGDPTNTTSEEKVTITFWHAYNADTPEKKILDEAVIPAFNKKYPNITVNAVVQPNDNLHDSLTAAVAGKTNPDVMRMDIIWVPEFAKLGALQALDDYAEFNTLKSTVLPGPLATNLYKGKHYGLPLDTNTQVAIYNSDFLKAAGMTAPPKTMDEFQQYLAAATKNGKVAFALSGPGPWTTLPWFWSLGGKLTNEDYTKADGYLNSTESVAALQTMYDMYKKGYMGKAMTGGQPDPWAGLQNGTYGVISDGPWTFPALQKNLGDKMIGAPIPAGKAGSISVVGGEDIVMFSNSKNKDAAWKFMQFMVSDEAQNAFAEVGQFPVTTNALNGSAMKKNAYYAPFVEQLKTAQPRTPVPTWSQIDTIVHDAFDAVFRDKATAKAALDKAAKEVDALLK